MPIRFRCAYCSQLMGIAKRKAGAVVKCPKCAGEIIVPTPEGHEAGPDGVELADNDLPETAPHDVTDDANTVISTETSAPMPVLPPPPPDRLGVFLSIGSLVVSVIVIILLMILMFVLGLIIGKSTGGQTSTACGEASIHCYAASGQAISLEQQYAAGKIPASPRGGIRPRDSCHGSWNSDCR